MGWDGTREAAARWEGYIMSLLCCFFEVCHLGYSGNLDGVVALPYGESDAFDGMGDLILFFLLNRSRADLHLTRSLNRENVICDRREGSAK
jgi:hypothetical protein